MIIGLIIVLLLVLLLPFISKTVEHNLEIFLFIMGIASVIVSKQISGQLFMGILEDKFVYMITIAVLVAGILFKFIKNGMKKAVSSILKHIPIGVFVFIVIVFLGLISSIITAIISALILVEIVSMLPVNRDKKVGVCIAACFSIGLGATLTPLGEPLSSIVSSKLHKSFWYLFGQLGKYIIPAIILFAIVGVIIVQMKNFNLFHDKNAGPDALEVSEEIEEEESYKEIIIRTIKIFAFVIALNLLGTGFKPFVDHYVVHVSQHILYWGNMLSAILDNATIAAAEISTQMSAAQVNAILMGLLISGGMLIPGNIPNIISAGKLKIKSKEWAKLGVPLGLSVMFIYYVILFLI